MPPRVGGRKRGSMSTNVRRDPGPDHPITVTPTGHLVTVTAQGRPVASSEHTLTLQEAGYAPVYYFPPTEVNWDVLRENQHTSYCPYKGDAGYVDAVLADGDTGENGDPTVIGDVGWFYAEPYEPVAAIAGHIAFYPDRVTITDHADAQGADLVWTDRSKERLDANHG
jgi:uncharacterized protein (DUF427 family)